MYTHRILDITNQIVKQNRDIDKITSDIRYPFAVWVLATENSLCLAWLQLAGPMQFRLLWFGLHGLVYM
jgi:hypothetical protein